MTDELLFCPLGGAGEIGMNMNLYSYGNPTNQKWIWMNEHTKFYLHKISMKHMNLMVGYWNLLVVNWNQNVFDEIQRAIIMVLMGLFVLSHRPSFRLCLLVVL